MPQQPNNNQTPDPELLNSMQGNGRGVFVNVPRFLPPGAVEEILNNMLQGVDSSTYIEGDPDAGIQTGWALKSIHHLATPPDGSLGGDRFIDWKWEHSHIDEYFLDITAGPPETPTIPIKSLPILPPLILPSEIRESRRQRREKARKKK